MKAIFFNILTKYIWMKTKMINAILKNHSLWMVEYSDTKELYWSLDLKAYKGLPYHKMYLRKIILT